MFKELGYKNFRKILVPHNYNEALSGRALLEVASFSSKYDCLNSRSFRNMSFLVIFFSKKNSEN